MKQMSTIKFPNQTESYEIVDAAARQDVAGKSNIGHTHTRSEITDFAHEHDERYYTETEIDTKLSEVNTSITNITNGSVTVKEAEHATSADSASEATHATSADSATTANSANTATKATQDGSGNVITDTYETKEDAQLKYDELKDIKSDWNQNDETASDYVKNRTHYIDKTFGTILEEQTVTIGNKGEATISSTQLFTIGETYTITLNGTTYELVAYSDSSGRASVGLVANDGFRCFTYSSGTVGLEANNGTYTIKIEGYTNTYFPLDEKYIPDTIARTTEIKAYADNAANTVKNDLLNGAGEQYDTLKELGELINENTTALDALEQVATGKADKVHTHAIADVTNLQTTLDAKVPTSRTINGKALSANITLSASDVSAYSKTEIDNMELITVADIDTICGTSIQMASEVMF